jgi:hypothetical protein
MTEFKEDDHVNYVHTVEDSQYYVSLEQIRRAVEGVQSRVALGKIYIDNGDGMWWGQSAADELAYIAKGIENTNNLYRLEERQREA